VDSRRPRTAIHPYLSLLAKVDVVGMVDGHDLAWVEEATA